MYETEFRNIFENIGTIMIAFLIRELNIRGGTHKQFLKLLEYTEEQGIDFYIVTEKLDLNKTYPGFRKYENKVRFFHHVPQNSFFGKFIHMFICIYRLRRLVNDASIINIHDPGFEKFLPAFIGKKTYWQINDLPVFFKVGVSKGGGTSFRDFILKKYVMLFRGVINEFTVNVTKNKERIHACFHRDAFVFYCGIEPINIKRSITESLDRFKNSRLNILTSGVFFPYRNYETQIDVIRLLREKGIDAHLNIIGSVDLSKKYVAYIQQLILENKLSEYITICGQVDEAKFDQLHQKSDLFMFINIDQSWGLAVFEAMSCSIPVIVSKSVGATEILTNGVNAILVDPVDSIEIVNSVISLISDIEAYKKIAYSSEVYHSLYSWNDAYCSKMINLMVGNDK